MNGHTTLEKHGSTKVVEALTTTYPRNSTRNITTQTPPLLTTQETLINKNMGTNYYYRTNICEKCGRFEEAHIGKSSAGWQFCFQMPNDVVIQSAKAMRTFLDGKLIFDEYGKTVTHEEFWKMVESKQGKARHTHQLIDVQGYDFIDSEFS